MPSHRVAPATVGCTMARRTHDIGNPTADMSFESIPHLARTGNQWQSTRPTGYQTRVRTDPTILRSRSQKQLRPLASRGSSKRLSQPMSPRWSWAKALIAYSNSLNRSYRVGTISSCRVPLVIEGVSTSVLNPNAHERLIDCPTAGRVGSQSLRSWASIPRYGHWVMRYE